MNCKIVKKWQLPPPPLPVSTSNPPFQGYSPFLARFLVPPSPKCLNFWKVLTLPPFNRGGGFQLLILFNIFSAICFYILTVTISQIMLMILLLTELATIPENSIFTWLAQNEMKANLDKWRSLLSTTEAFNLQISETVIHNSHSRKLLGVTLNKLKFEKHKTTICRKANRKLNALTTVTSYIDLQKRRILINAFFNSQFNYCRVIWMFHSRALNNKINRLHERWLRTLYNDKTSTFNELLEKDNSVSIHYRNI